MLWVSMRVLADGDGSNCNCTSLAHICVLLLHSSLSQIDRQLPQQDFTIVPASSTPAVLVWSVSAKSSTADSGGWQEGQTSERRNKGNRLVSAGRGFAHTPSH